MNIYDFWNAVLAQDEQEIRTYFREGAYINWHCTNEHFTVDEFIVANCKYPGDWDGEVERVERADDLLIAVTRVWPKDKTASFHVTSFIKAVEDKIASVDEYWADDGDAPRWRQNMKIGTKIRTP